MPIFKKRTQIKLIQWLFPILETYCPPCAHRFACWLFLRPFRFPFTKNERKAIEAADKETIVVHGKKVQIYSWGSGPYFLFVHGWSGRGTNLCAFIEPIVAHGWRLIAFDAPAHGKSEGQRTNFLEFVDVMEAIISEHGEPAGYIGHSLGGMAVYHYAEKNKRACPVVMISSPSEERDIFQTFFRRLHGLGRQKSRLKEWVIKETGFQFDAELPLYDNPLPDPSQLLLIHDREDIDCSVEDSIRLHEGNPGATLIITEGLGHLSILSDAQVIKSVLIFLEKYMR